MKPRIIKRRGLLFTLKDWPVKAANPAKFRVAIYRDGEFVGAAKKIEDAERRIKWGLYDEDDKPVEVDEGEPVGSI